mgnify:CR=1 FL=1
MTISSESLQRVREYLLSLQDRIVTTFERLDGKAFVRDAWERPAGGRLEGSVEHAAEKLSGVIEQGIDKAGAELRDVLREGSREIDAKLDKISQELSSQRHFTKNDVRDLVDYAADRFGDMFDQRVQGAKQEIAALVEEKVEYLKNEVDTFFIRRQQDLARERRRLLMNVMIAVLASVGVAAVWVMRWSAMVVWR